MRKLAVLFVVLGALTGVAVAQPNTRDQRSPNAGKKFQLERVVAVVNDSIILQSELEARLLPLQAQAAQITESAANLSESQLRLLLGYVRARSEVSRDEADRLRREGKPHATRGARPRAFIPTPRQREQ